jgi:hypothetical protein
VGSLQEHLSFHKNPGPNLTANHVPNWSYLLVGRSAETGGPVARGRASTLLQVNQSPTALPEKALLGALIAHQSTSEAHVGPGSCSESNRSSADP